MMAFSPSALACAPVVVASPDGKVTCEAGKAEFSCIVTGAALEFAWQVDEGSGFVAVTNGGAFEGATTPTLTVSSVSATFHGYLYRCFVTNSCGAVTTGVAMLRVGAEPTASCTPTTLNTGNYGTGIDRVQFAAIDRSHADVDNDGLQDFVCSDAAVLAPGSNYLLTVTLNPANPEYCRVYIDFNDDGAYSAGEIVLDGAPATSHSTTVTNPPYPAVTEKLVRMRVIADYNAIAGGCNDVDYGEIEDYGLYFTAPPCTTPVVNTNPSADFACSGAAGSFSCDVTGPSLHYQWQVNEGAGFVAVTNSGIYSGATSAMLSLSAVTNTMNGFQYRCRITNTCGSATSAKAVLHVGDAPTAACMPSTVNSGNFGTGIIRVQFNAIDNVHNDDLNDGTQDFTCSDKTLVEQGSNYLLTVTLYGTAEFCRVYIDYDNDATFAAGEMVYNAGSRATSHSTTITIPTTGVATNTMLRMRVISDFNTIVSGCADVSYGEVEDYGLFINAPAPRTIVGLAQASGTNVAVYSVGAIAVIGAEYTTNLVGTQVWTLLTNGTTTINGGTNLTTFTSPPGLTNAILRVIEVE